MLAAGETCHLSDKSSLATGMRSCIAWYLRSCLTKRGAGSEAIAAHDGSDGLLEPLAMAVRMLSSSSHQKPGQLLHPAHHDQQVHRIVLAGLLLGSLHHAGPWVTLMACQAVSLQTAQGLQLS